MIMHFESVKRNPVDYVGGRYLLLYPLLNEYWDKSLSEMPEDLRARAKHVIRCWDDIGGLDPSEQGASLLMPRQEQIKIYDMQRDDTQERETYIALHGYLNGGEVGGERGKGGYFVEGQLKQQIEKAQASGNYVLAEFLSTEVSRPLQQICDEVGMHWLNPKPLLWRAICKFRWLTLQGILGSTERENNIELLQNLRDVNTYLYRIINLDRVRIRKVWGDLEDDFEIVFCTLKEHRNLGNEKTVANILTANLNRVIDEQKADDSQKRSSSRQDALAREIDIILSSDPTLTPSRVAAKLKDRIGKDNSQILEITTGGLKWERDSGVLEEVNFVDIEKRVARWKKASLLVEKPPHTPR